MKLSLKLWTALKYLPVQCIFAHIFDQTIGGATSITVIRDFHLPHNPTKFHKDPSKIKEVRVFTSFSHFGPYIT